MDKFSEEEFAPLFDYTGVNSASVLCLSDDDSDSSPLVSKSKRKRKNGGLKGGRFNYGREFVHILDEEEEGKGNKKCDEEEDWLRPPPKAIRVVMNAQDKTLQALRSTKQELVSLAASARDMMNSVSDFGNDDVLITEKSDCEEVTVQKCSEKAVRERVLISIQDKNGHKQFRLFVDDKFERLFKIYAEQLKLKLENLTFSFDGDRISPQNTPAGLGLENDDIIEVHIRS